MTSLLSHKCERCECGVDSRHPARSDGRARASLAARRSAPPGTIRIGTSTATKMFRIQLTKINQSERSPRDPGRARNTPRPIPSTAVEISRPDDTTGHTRHGWRSDLGGGAAQYNGEHSHHNGHAATPARPRKYHDGGSRRANT